MSKVKYTRDTLPPLTKAQQGDLNRRTAMASNRVDMGDMPELTDAQLSDMRQGAFYRPVKTQITARVDSDVLAWLKAQGKGYQSRMNSILREAMLNTK